MTSEETQESDSQEEEQTQFYMKKGYPKGLGKGLGKGKGKGKKGKPGKGGYRDHQHRHVAPQLSFDGSKGKGKGKTPFKGKGKSFHFGNRSKGDAGLPHRGESSSSSAVSSHTAITCDSATKLATLLTIAESVKLCIVAPCTNKLGANLVVGSNCYSTS